MVQRNLLDNKKRILFKKNEFKSKLYKSLLLALETQKNLFSTEWDLVKSNTYYQFKFYLLLKLSSLKKNSFKTKISNRCIWTGRSRSIYSKFKMSRITFKKHASLGEIPGYSKYSW